MFHCCLSRLLNESIIRDFASFSFLLRSSNRASRPRRGSELKADESFRVLVSLIQVENWSFPSCLSQARDESLAFHALFQKSRKEFVRESWCNSCESLGTCFWFFYLSFSERQSHDCRFLPLVSWFSSLIRFKIQSVWMKMYFFSVIHITMILSLRINWNVNQHETKLSFVNQGIISFRAMDKKFHNLTFELRYTWIVICYY